jgi:hypothetical protein
MSINDDEYEEIIMYNELMDFIKKNKENEDIGDSYLLSDIKAQSSAQILTTKGPSTMC